MAKKVKSIEEQIEDWCKKQFNGQKYYTKTECINPEIEMALEKAPSKQGGSGKNYPDIKFMLISDNGRKIPVMIEVKGKKGDLIKVNEKGEVENKKKNLDPNYQNIAKYAVNGAIHYANAILDHTETYKEVVAIGANGYEEGGNTIHEVDVWYPNMLVPMKMFRFYWRITPRSLLKNLMRLLFLQKNWKNGNLPLKMRLNVS